MRHAFLFFVTWNCLEPCKKLIGWLTPVQGVLYLYGVKVVISSKGKRPGTNSYSFVPDMARSAKKNGSVETVGLTGPGSTFSLSHRGSFMMDKP